MTAQLTRITKRLEARGYTISAGALGGIRLTCPEFNNGHLKFRTLTDVSKWITLHDKRFKHIEAGENEAALECYYQMCQLSTFS